jgi:predicted RNA-binding Zn ribbon-like protein
MTRTKSEWDRKFDLSGGALCLDFANTVLRRNQPGRTRDELESFARLVSFARQTKLLVPARAELLRNRAPSSSPALRHVMLSAVTLREAVYRVFSAIAGGRPVASEDLKVLEEFALDALAQRRLVPSRRGGYVWQWKPEEVQLPEQIIGPIALSAVQLLTSDKVAAVRECAADDCAWLFLDESRNRTRRWCDMKVCGNRQKARRYYERQK